MNLIHLAAAVLALRIPALCLSASTYEEQTTLTKRSSACYPRVGCFSTGKPFSGTLQRPFTLLPQSVDTIQVKYLLFTRSTGKTPLILDARQPDTFKNMWVQYSASKPTKLIIHGFTDSYYINDWMKVMALEYLKQGDYNAIVVDWHHGNLPPYTQATANTRLVGAMVADLVKTIMNATGQSASDFHLAGHSLGSHIAGYAGERIPGLGRITGMDPAGPYFEDTPTEVRLDPSDATFVDNIHSDASPLLTLGFGMKQPIGHADFYPNGGHDQPGCTHDPVSNIADLGLVQGSQEAVACNHLRSWKFYTESINSHCPFVSVPCNNEDDWKNHQCADCGASGCNRMGLHATKPAANTKYYFATSDESPFCQYHVAVTITLGSHSREHGTLSVRLQGDLSSSPWLKVTHGSVDLEAGTVLRYTAALTSDIGKVTSADVTWHHVASITDPLHWNPLGLRHPSIAVSEIKLEALEGDGDVSTRLCANSKLVEQDTTVQFATPCTH